MYCITDVQRGNHSSEGNEMLARFIKVVLAASNAARKLSVQAVVKRTQTRLAASHVAQHLSAKAVAKRQAKLQTKEPKRNRTHPNVDAQDISMSTPTTQATAAQRTAASESELSYKAHQQRPPIPLDHVSAVFRCESRNEHDDSAPYT